MCFQRAKINLGEKQPSIFPPRSNSGFTSFTSVSRNNNNRVKNVPSTVLFFRPLSTENQQSILDKIIYFSSLMRHLTQGPQNKNTFKTKFSAGLQSPPNQLVHNQDPSGLQAMTSHTDRQGTSPVKRQLSH